MNKTKLRKALKYSINQREELRSFLEDNKIGLSNNRAENTIQSFSVARCNWLFTNIV